MSKNRLAVRLIVSGQVYFRPPALKIQVLCGCEMDTNRYQAGSSLQNIGAYPPRIPSCGGMPQVAPPTTYQGGAITTPSLTDTEYSLYCSLDHIEITVPSSVGVDICKIKANLALHQGMYETWMPREYGTKHYKFMLLGPGGATIQHAPTHREQQDIHLTFPGKACRQMGPIEIYYLIRWALRESGSFSRIDVAWDDYRWIKTPAEVRSLCIGEHSTVVTHVSKGYLASEEQIHSGEQTGLGYYIGSRNKGSLRFLRIYDKNLESDGEIDAVRWELQNRDEAAQEIAKRIGSLEHDNWHQHLTPFLFSFIDFRDHDATRSNNRTRSDWFNDLFGPEGKCKAYPCKPARSLAKSAQAFGKAYKRLLAVFVEAAQGDLSWFSSLVAAGRSALTSEDKRLIQEAQLQGGLTSDWFRRDTGRFSGPVPWPSLPEGGAA